MIIHDVLQGSDEWKILKAGHFSGSKAAPLLMAKTTAGWKNLISQIAYERHTGEPVESYKNEWMEYGNDTEPIARESYELKTYNKVNQTGFIELNEWVGVSPDGLISKDGGLEIKCVKWNTQIERLLENKVPTEHHKQIQFCLYVTGRKWWDYYSYHPKLPELLITVERDEEMITKIQEQIFMGIKEVEKIINKLR